MTRVLVLRAREDAERTASRLRAMGFTPLLSPVLEIVGTGAAIPRGPFDAVLATSAKGLEFCAEPEELRTLPLHAVGARTAHIARELGWRPDLFAGEARGLAPLIRARYATPARFLYLAGRDRQSDLETGLRAAGHEVTIVETYEARAATALAPAALDALAKGKIAAALHYSRRSAEIFVKLARDAGLTKALGEIDHLALSREAASPLPRARIAERPDEEHLLRLLRNR
ncbi:MAG: uroporphyrinogen-III synthase [Methylocystis sp.]